MLRVAWHASSSLPFYGQQLPYFFKKFEKNSASGATPTRWGYSLGRILNHLEAQLYYDIHQPVVERCRSGDRKAQYELYKLYAKAMLNVAYRITNNQAEAEDVLQEAFLSAFRHIHAYKGDATFGSWLKRIVVHQALGVVRKRKVRFDEIGERDYADDSRTDDRETAWEVDRVRKAIALLPDGYRVVLSLYLLEGYDHQEIADILGITESTSKSQYSRARQKLLQLLK
jgi:RNA polymerase sigma-70 factor (ECF subfamily)